MPERQCAGRDQAAEAQTLLQQARDSLKELTRLDGSKVCRHCGQPLTEGHLEEEKRRRAPAVAEAEAKLKQATAAHRPPSSTSSKSRAEFDQAERLARMRVEYRVKEKADRPGRTPPSAEECGQIYGDLPEPTAPRRGITAGRLAGDGVPDADDLARCARRPTACRRRELLQQAEQVRDQWHKLVRRRRPRNSRN